LILGRIDSGEIGEIRIIDVGLLDRGRCGAIRSERLIIDADGVTLKISIRKRRIAAKDNCESRVCGERDIATDGNSPREICC
jgi:hypothetical protein